MWPTEEAKKAMHPRDPGAALLQNGTWNEDEAQMRDELVCTVSLLGRYYRIVAGSIDLDSKYSKRTYHQKIRNKVFEDTMTNFVDNDIIQIK